MFPGLSEGIASQPEVSSVVRHEPDSDSAAEVQCHPTIRLRSQQCQIKMSDVDIQKGVAAISRRQIAGNVVIKAWPDGVSHYQRFPSSCSDCMWILLD